MGDSISEGTIVTILKNSGDYVKADEPVIVIETDKVSVDVNAPFAGKVVELLAKPDDLVQVGKPLFVLGTSAVNEEVSKVSIQEDPPSKPEDSTSSKETAHNETQPQTKASTSLIPTHSDDNLDRSTAAKAPVNSRKFSRNETRVKLGPFMTRTAERIKDTQNDAAMLSTFQEARLSLLELRRELQDSFVKTHGLEFGLLSFFIKASTMALRKVPQVNAYFDWTAKEIVYNNYVDINVAVAAYNGIVVPVIRNPENLSIPALEKSLHALRMDAENGSLAIEDLAGGTFTILNAGIHDALLSTSMLTSPQSAALSIHSIRQRPAVVHGEIVPRPMMFLSLTYDHRIIDGREAVTFLKIIAEGISDPRRLLLEL
uniref:Dihydrolipoamide acetyltransferase component of pyruvate dehydrogenase complex n=1 Tax=Albugo laibachii Nc14 TaxID=890382 RepID=F0W969_9STRA|nr:unnamed protein product [Albugo laibachii Nc14]|eukprot:CCA17682.1 unnamed protein product [Albugo laibachii Nc14]